MDGFINNLIRSLVTIPVNPDAMPVVAPHDEPMDTDHDHDDNDHDDADSVLDLQSLSDSDYEIDSDEHRDRDGSREEDEDEETEVMMQTVNADEELPPLEPISRTNRRPRVQDDEDGDRDRRHPSQRINQPLDVTNPSQDPPPPSWNGPVNTGIAVPFRPSLAWMNAVQAQAQQAQSNQQPNQNQQQQPQQQPPQPAQQGRQPLINGFAITIDINGQRVVRPLQTGVPFDGPGPGPTVGGFADFLGFLSALSERETDDPERAKRLVDALEEVPVGLVRRLEALSGKTADVDADGEAGAGGMGAGDCACAICWDTLLDGEGGFAVHQDESAQEGQAQDQEASAPPPPSTSSESSTAPSTKLVSSSDPTQPKIVSLPCAHVFHAACLIPWFSRPRQTTCPTCRFNIDPDRLTARRMPMRGIYRPRTQGQAQGQAGQQQQANVASDAQGAPVTNVNANADAPNPDPAQTPPQTQQQPQPQPVDGNANAHGQRNLAHGAIPGAVLTIGFDIVIGPNPNMGHNANANANPAQNANASHPVPNTNTNAGADEGNNQNPNPNPNPNQNPNQNQNQNPNPAFTMGPMNMDMGNIMAGMGMGGMDDDESNEVAMMDMNNAQAVREFGEFLRDVLPPHTPGGLHPHPHLPTGDAVREFGEFLRDGLPPHPPGGLHPHPHLPTGDAVPAPPAPAPQQPQQQQPQPGQGQAQMPMTGVFSGTAMGHTLGEALAALFSQPLQPVNMPQAGTQNAGAGVPTQPGGQHAQGQHEQHGEHEHEHEGHEEDEEHEGEDEGQDQEGHGHEHGQEGHGMPDQATFQNFLSALFASVAQQQAQQMQTRTAGQGQGQGVANNNSDVQAEDQPQPQPQPQNTNPNPNANAPLPGLVMGGMPLPPMPGTFVGPPVFNLGNLFAGLGDVFGANGGNAPNGQPDANANNNADQPNADANAPGPAVNIPFIPFASLFPGATLTPPPLPAPDPAPGSAVGDTVDEGQAPQAAEHNAQHQPAEQQPAQAEADDGSLLGAFTRLFPGAEVAILSQTLNAPNGGNAANPPNAPQPQPQQAGGFPLPPWARNLNPQLFPGPLQPQQPQQQGQAPGQGQTQQPPGFTRLHPPRAPREKKPWTLPPPPGPTLRQRIEKREREAGLRCYDVSCGVGPSDEDPFVGLTEKTMRQLSIRARTWGVEEGQAEAVCPHTFHPACLVSAARVANALMGGDGVEDVKRGEDGDSGEVSCPVCRSVGSVRREEWDEGVRTLA